MQNVKMQMNKLNKFGQAAVLATEMVTRNQNLGSVDAWGKATMDIFGESTSQRKGCPKGVFLGLCEEGLVKGIPIGKYTKSKRNKRYAIRIMSFIQNHPEDKYNQD